MPAQHGGRRIEAVDKSLDILRFIAEEGDTTVSVIAEHVGLAPGTVHTHLSTLRAHGFIEQVDGRYQLGMEFIPFSERVRNQTPLYRAGKDEVDKLAHQYDAVAHLATEYNGKILILHETFGEDAVGKQIHIEKRDEPQTHMHCTAAGKAILAHLPEERVTEIIDENLANVTEITREAIEGEISTF